MKRLSVLFILLAIFLISGCATKRLVHLSEKNIESVEQAKILAHNMNQTWQFRSGEIKAFKDQLDGETLAIIKELDDINSETSFDDETLGRSLMLHVKLIRILSKEIYNELAPYILDIVR